LTASTIGAATLGTGGFLANQIVQDKTKKYMTTPGQYSKKLNL